MASIEKRIDLKKIIIMIGVCLMCSLIGSHAFAAEPKDFWQYEKNIEQVAEPITEQIMQAINNDDYSSFQNKISTRMQGIVTEDAFKKMKSDLKNKFGDYQAKEVMNIELREEYMIVNYKGFFNQATDPILISVVLMKENEKTCVGGLWFNPMQLVGHTNPNPFNND